MSIYEVLELIGQQTECTFIYQSDIFNDVPNIPLKSGVIKVMTLLSQCLPESDYTITTTNETYITISKKVLTPTQQRQIEVKGQITDTEGLPISGAFISIKGSHKGTTSLIDGTYSINASADDILVFSYLGFLSQTIPVDGQHVINVQLQDDVTAFDAVVLNAGYYSVKDKERTGSITKVDASVIEGQPVTTALDALQGRVAGLDVVSTTGLAGGGYTVRIRGQNSIAAGNDPLYVIDGVPFDSGSMSNGNLSVLIMPNGVINPLNTLAPSSIESIEVLKDADATAIYGSRGTNGVILISTKTGKAGKTLFSADISTTFMTPTRLIDLLQTDDYLNMRREAFVNDGITDIPIDAYDLNGTWDENRYTDWQKELIANNAYNHTFRASVSGGDEHNRFMLGGTYLKETTVYPKDFNYKRGTANTSFTHTSIDNKFELQFSGSYGNAINTLPASDLSRVARVLPPNAPELYDENGALNWAENTWTNPVAALNAKYENKTTTLIANSTLSYRLTPNLNARLTMGYNKGLMNEIQLNPHTIYNPAFGLNSSSSYSMKNNSDRQSWILEPKIDGSVSLGSGQLTWLMGATLQEQKNEQLALMGFGYASNQLLDNLSAANNLIPLNEASSEYKYAAVYGRVNYNINQTYIFNITGRRDGSSRFGFGNRFANFGAIGAAWLFSKASFFEDSTWLSFGKLRASFGTTGNDQIGDYQYLDSYSITDGNYDGNIGLTPSRLLNPYYAWETTRKIEGGLEMELWKNSIRFEVAYYNNRSDNQLLGMPLPGTTGFSSINGNLDALVENSGWELSLNTVNIDQDQFRWESSFQFTLPKNRLLAFDGLEDTTYANQLVVGEPLSVYRLYKLIGVNSNTGLFDFEDFNGDGMITASEDRQYNADLNPQFYGSISNRFQYKNWSLDLLLQFVKKKGLNAYYTTEPPGIMQNQPLGVLDQWQNPGDEASMQAYTIGWNYDAYIAYSQFTASSGVISDASFMRLKSMSLNYRLPLGEATPECSIYLQGQNLLTFTRFKGGDPEQNAGYLPPLKRISLGMKLKF
ncbi:SusC/RagA family TonB-linked outer membrane protein [Winogradskyella undariae]|uniref:SusC/RagA family TonB-linked outer membrane protein n=1 Tax=Winogradskyella undariae TaxID=1285465 RepID=UPI0020C56642|nr:SusC/RagA family TonB-linked outer membrane protein [Winogradskyella undariae]